MILRKSMPVVILSSNFNQAVSSMQGSHRDNDGIEGG